MKKVLLGTASAIGLAMLAQPAAAQVTVTLGGSVEFEAGWFDVEGANTREHDFRTDSEIHVRVDGKADNGLLYGAAVELEADQGSTNNVDEAYVYVGGGWGRVELGDEDGAANDFYVFAPTIGNEQIDGSWDAYLNAVPAQGWFTPDDTSDSTKITYVTPSFGGFQAGVSYIPSVNDFGGSVDLVEGDNAENAFEFGAQWGGDFAGFGVTVGGTYYMADAVAGTADNAWSAGAQVGYAGFTLGGGYFNEEVEGAGFGDRNGWNAGVSYTNGPIAVAAQYADGEHFPAAGVDADYTIWGVGAAYTVAPGLVTAVDYVSADNDLAEESVIIGSVKLSF